MVYRASRKQALKEEEPEGFSLQEPRFAPDTAKSEKHRRQLGLWRTAAILLTLLAIGLIIVVFILVTRDQTVSSMPTCGESNQAKAAIRQNKNIIDRSEPSQPGPFHDLTKHELRQVRAFLEVDPNIHAAKPESAEMDQNIIYMIDLFPPKKSEVLQYLDHKGPQPERQARVLLYRGDLNPPMVHELVCGPLPNINSCDMLKNPKRRNPVEFSLRPIGLMEFDAIYTHLLSQVDKKVGYILRERYGTTFTQCSNPKECFKLYPSPMATNLVSDITQRRMWLWATHQVEYYVLHPVDFGVLAVLDGSKPSEYRVDKIWFRQRLYHSFDDLIAAYNATRPDPSTRVLRPDNDEKLYSSLNLRGDPQPSTPQRPPTLVEPDGRRYSLKDRKVEYLGWSFHFKMSALTGPSVFDIRYKGERIAYEIGVAEIAVFYAGNNPGPRATDYVDSGALIGSHSKSLVPGGDCPETATFINQTFSGQAVSEPVELDRSFCLFENNNGYPLRRHLSYSQSEGGFYGGMLDSVLVLRSALTIVNYDYIVDFIFHQNGVIETTVMSTGYILPTFYDPKEDPYGFNIEKNLIGNIHHHLFHFKVDLDIGGTSNRYETLDIVPEEVFLRMVPNKTYHQEKYVRNLKETEKEALYKYNFDHPKHHVVHNNAKKTRFGAIKAYRIAMDGMSKQLLPENQGSEGTISWARHQMVVTKHKDDEAVSSSPYAMWDSFNPVTNFSKFYEDNENIVDEDLVFWVTEGLHHIPHTEDLPVTPTVGNHLKFFLMPYNYFDECPSLVSRDHIRVEHKDKSDPKKGVKVIRNGNSKSQCITPPLAQQYEDLVENDPDIVLESREFRGIF